MSRKKEYEASLVTGQFNDFDRWWKAGYQRCSKGHIWHFIEQSYCLECRIENARSNKIGLATEFETPRSKESLEIGVLSNHWELTDDYIDWRLDIIYLEQKVQSWWFPKLIRTSWREKAKADLHKRICQGSQQLEHGSLARPEVVKELVDRCSRLYKSVL